MRFSPVDDEIELYQTGFADDLLGRKKVSERLSNLLERIEDPLVIALDGPWGTGKSHFLKRWVGAHRNENNGSAKTIYFDAFAHDYLSDPLVALIAAISERSGTVEVTKINRLKNAAYSLLKPATRIGLAIATSGATTVLGEIGDAAAGATSNEVGKALDVFWKKEEGRQKAMQEFRIAIEDLTLSKSKIKKNSQVNAEKTPLIIVIDELDRCRPDYALEILEIIKHFFAVPHVHFVLGVNLKALENSVKARYGTGIDATAYLQKFLSFSVVLPEHIGDRDQTLAILKYIDFLSEKMNSPQHLIEILKEHVKLISERSDSDFRVSIRDVGKIISSISILPEAATEKQSKYGWDIILISLIIFRVLDSDTFQSLRTSSIKLEKLWDIYGLSEKNIICYFANERQNEHFDRQARDIALAWMYVLKDGDLSGTSSEITGGEDVSKMFTEFRLSVRARNIPRSIYEKHLTSFKLN